MGASPAAVADVRAEDPPRDGSLAQGDAAAAGECFRCGYVLHGITDDQPCPECGLLAERSRRATDELHDTRPGWLRRLSLATILLLLAVVAAVIGPAVWGFVKNQWVNGTFFTPGGFVGPSPRWGHASGLGFEVAVLLLLAGVWLMTGPEGYPPADRADAWQRRRLRIAALMPLVAVVLFHAKVEMSIYASFNPWVGFSFRANADQTLAELFLKYVDVAIALILTVGCVPFPLLLFRRFRGLAKRARSAHLAEHCTIAGIGTSAALAFAAGCYALFENGDRWFHDSYWAERSTDWLVVGVALGTVSLLFVLWSVYLMIRFAIAFGVAAFRLRATWRRADRSVLSVE